MKNRLRLVGVVGLIAAVALVLPAATAAKTQAAAAPARAAGGYCAFGTMNGDGEYRGVIPYFHAGGYFVPSVTITNVNWLGFVGDLQFYLFQSLHQDIHVVLLPYFSATYSKWGVVSTANGIPFKLELSPFSDATALAYRVCV